MIFILQEFVRRNLSDLLLIDWHKPIWWIKLMNVYDNINCIEHVSLRTTQILMVFVYSWAFSQMRRTITIARWIQGNNEAKEDKKKWCHILASTFNPKNVSCLATGLDDISVTGQTNFILLLLAVLCCQTCH